MDLELDLDLDLTRLTDTLSFIQEGVQISHNYSSKPPYPPQFRQPMVELVAEGREPSELAKEFGCHEASILSWVRRAARVGG